jgi:hypothetical protein
MVAIALPDRPRTADTRVVEPEKMVFTLRDVADAWPDALRRFLEMARGLGSVTDLYFAVVNSPELYIEVQFLNFAQALESFHRSTRGAA